MAHRFVKFIKNRRCSHIRVTDRWDYNGMLTINKKASKKPQFKNRGFCCLSFLPIFAVEGAVLDGFRHVPRL